MKTENLSEYRAAIAELIDHISFALFMRSPLLWHRYDCEAREFCNQLIEIGKLTEDEALQLYDAIIESAKKGRH